MFSLRIVHARRAVQSNYTAQVGFFFVLLGVEPVGAGKYFPIDVAGTLAFVVKAMFGKLNRETMVGRLMQPGNKTLNQLFGQQL